MVATIFDRADSVLCVIDVQQVFLDKLGPGEAAPLVSRIAWLIRAAGLLGVPVIAMAEDVARNGPPVAAVRDALPEGTHIHDKRFFGLAGQADILATVRDSGRGQAVLCGLETDVCVAQSAIGLRAAGLTVGITADACGSPGPCHAAGLARMRGAGVAELSVKGVYYEWVRDLDTLARVKPALADLPEGLTL